MQHLRKVTGNQLGFSELRSGVGRLAGGCVALRSLQNQACEKRRRFIQPDYLIEPGYRGTSASRLLALTVTARAKALGYRAIRLDTVPPMAAAIQIYESLGFQSIEPYCQNPVPGSCCWNVNYN